MKKVFSALVLVLLACQAFADGPLIPSTGFTRNFLHATNSTDAQTRLGFTGTNVTAVTLNVISNTAIAAVQSVPLSTNAISSVNSTNFGGNPPSAYLQLTNITVVTTNVYNLLSFGAIPASNVVDVVYTAGSKTITSPNGTWNAGDIGKIIIIHGAGSNEEDLVTIVTNVASGTSITVSNAALLNAANTGISQAPGWSALYGYDSSAAIQAWVNQFSNGAANFYAPGSKQGGGTYIIADKAVLVNSNNAQIIIPVPYWNYPAGTLAGNCIPTFHMYGDFVQYTWGQAEDKYSQPLPGQTLFYSTLYGTNAPFVTNGLCASIFDFRGYNPGNVNVTLSASHNGASGVTAPANPVHPVIENISFWNGWDNDAAALNLIATAQPILTHVQVNGMGGCQYTAFATNAPTGTNGYGIILPGEFNGTYATLNDVTVGGYYNGIDLGLGQGPGDTVEVCHRAFSANMTGGAAANHFTDLQLAYDVEWLGTAYNGGGSPATSVSPQFELVNWSYDANTNALIIDRWPWYDPQPAPLYVDDPGNQFGFGWIRFPANGTSGATGYTNPVANIIATPNVVSEIWPEENPYPAGTQKHMNYPLLTSSFINFSNLVITGPYWSDNFIGITNWGIGNPSGNPFFSFGQRADGDIVEHIEASPGSDPMVLQNVGSANFRTGFLALFDQTENSEMAAWSYQYQELVPGQHIVWRYDQFQGDPSYFTAGIGTNGSGGIEIDTGTNGQLQSLTASMVSVTGGIGSSATNWVKWTTTGITNTLPVDLQVFIWNSSGGAYLTNFNTHFGLNLGALSSQTTVLQPGDAIVSPGGFNSFTNRAL